MKPSTRQLTIGAAVLAAGVFSADYQASAAAFTPGDLVTYRVGDGAAALSNAATASFLDEYTPAGVLVQSIALSTGQGTNVTASGTATSEGLLSLSANGQYLSLTGYNAAVGTAAVAGTTSTAVNRTVDIFNANGAASSTSLTDLASGNNVRGAVSSNDGQSFYASGATGINYATVGATTSTALSTTNSRYVTINNGQLYGTSGSGTTRIFTVGTGTPTTGTQTYTNLPGVSSTANSTSPYEFTFATLTAGGTSPDTFYAADSTRGIEKFSLVSGTWTLTGTVTLTGVTGITVSTLSNGTANIYASAPNALYSLVDTTGFNGTLAGTPTSIVASTTNEAFRGLSFVPTVVPEPTTILGGVLLLGMAGWTLRRRQTRNVAPLA